MDTTIGIVWDVDGTLLDSAEHHFEAWVAFAKSINKPFTRDDFADTFGWRNPDILRKLFDPSVDDATCAEWADRKETLYRDAVRRNGAALLPGIAAALANFADAGWLQAVGSSAPRANLDLLFEVTGIARFFRTVVSGDDVSKGKPDPEVFLKAAAGIGVPPRKCVVFEDAPAGVQAAKNAGMVCVGVTFVGHHSGALLKSMGADRVVRTVNELTVDDVRGLLRRIK